MNAVVECPTDQTSASLRAAYAQARRDGGVRHRDIAEQLQVSEGELIAAHVAAHVSANVAAHVRPLHPSGHGDEPGLVARRLRADWARMVSTLGAAGEVMALTRNRSCVHEKTGTYRNVSGSDHVGLVLGDEIDLRVFYRQWAHGFAVDEATPRGLQRSLQFFDAAGTAIHKVFVKPKTDLNAWDELLTSFLAADQAAGMAVQAITARDAELADCEIDVAALRDGWATMRDTHEFFGLLKKHKVSRTQALRLAEPRFVQPMAPGAERQMLSAAAVEGVPIMVFVGNPGMIQIHSGAVRKVMVMGPWLNVLDEGFNLHLRQDHVASAFIVRKPTDDGWVTALELFDAAGETIAMFFGERKPGRAELPAWRDLIERLEREAIARDAPCVP